MCCISNAAFIEDAVGLGKAAEEVLTGSAANRVRQSEPEPCQRTQEVDKMETATVQIGGVAGAWCSGFCFARLACLSYVITLEAHMLCIGDAAVSLTRVQEAIRYLLDHVYSPDLVKGLFPAAYSHLPLAHTTSGIAESAHHAMKSFLP